MTAEEFVKSKEWTQTTVHFNINDVIDLFQEYARIKCLEAIKNTRHKAADIAVKFDDNGIAHLIQNIRNQDVMPEL